MVEIIYVNVYESDFISRSADNKSGNLGHFSKFATKARHTFTDVNRAIELGMRHQDYLYTLPVFRKPKQ